MIAAILQLSYNAPGDLNLIGGTRGSAFLVGKQTMMTAHHVLNRKVIHEVKPGYILGRWWVLVQAGMAIPITEDMLLDYPQIDTTVIRLKAPVPGLKIWQWSSRPPMVSDRVHALGYEAEVIPAAQFYSWQEGELQMGGHNLSPFANRGRGAITRIGPTSAKSEEKNVEVELADVQCIQTTCGIVTGMSGGPLINNGTDRVVGLTSFGTDKYHAKGIGSFFIHKDEILKRIGLDDGELPTRS